MKPNIGDAKVDKILSQFSQMYRNENYICEKILPTLKVKEKTGKYAQYGKENLRTYTDQIYRAPGTRAMSIDYSVSQGDYICRERSLEKLVPDEMANNTDDPYDPKRDAVEFLMDTIWINQERALATTMSDNSVMTNYTTLSGTSQWSDYVNSDPLGDIRTGINAVRTATAQKPNIMVLSYATYIKLVDHPDIREQLKYTNGGQLGEEAFVTFLKKHFKLEEVHIADAVYNSSDEGQSDSLADVWGKHAWLLYKTPRPTLMRATFGLTLYDLPRKVDTYREEPKKSDVIRQSYSYDQNMFDVNLCYFLENAVA